VKRLGERLGKLGYPVAALQGNLSQNARDRVMADFRSGQTTILLATNVAARGIDVATVERVINFDLPESSDLLTHRVGRTGRMGRLGSAITLVAPEEAAKWRQLERDMGRAFPRTIWRDEYATNPPTLAMPPQPPARQIVPRAAAPERRPAPPRMQPGRPSQHFGNAPQPGNRPAQGFGNGPTQHGRPAQGFGQAPVQQGRPAQGFAPAPVQGGRPAQGFGSAPQQGGGPRGFANDRPNARPDGGNMRRRPRRSPVSMD